MDTVISQVQALAKGADEAGRKVILTALRDLSASIESSDDTMMRLWGSQLVSVSVRIGVDLKIFRILSAAKKPMSLDELVKETSSDKTLLARILRHQASIGLIKETDRDQFAASSITETLSTEGNEGCVKHYFDACGPVYQEIPAFLAKTGYKDVTDSHQTVWQDAWKTKENCFSWMMQHPDKFANFNVYMASRREHQTLWSDVYPLKEDATNLSADRVTFVDVGGSIGHQCADFKQKFPDLPGKVVLQDLPFAVEHAIPTPGVETQAIDFFKEQPTKGAKFYYLRAVLHDWPDDKCQIILKHIMDAMADDSIILVDDMVPPNKGVPWHVTQIDLTMMAAAASLERTEAMWQDLFDSAGLKILRRHVYTPGMYETVTALVPK